MKALKQVARLGAFLLLALISSFIIIAVDIVAIPLALNYPEDYAGSVSLPAMLIIALGVVILFKKVVLRKSVKSLFIAIVFYIACNAMAVFMIAIKEPDLAPAFAWTGVIGIVAGFVISKTKNIQAA